MKDSLINGIALGFDATTIFGMESDDQQSFNEAEGWFDLGNLDAALAALDKISPGVCEQPAVLEMRYHICVKRRNWEAALEFAEDLASVAPDNLNSATLLGCALHQLGRNVEAYNILKPACDAFPIESSPPYVLARVCCALGEIEEARKWLTKALNLGGSELRLEALDDEELTAIW